MKDFIRYTFTWSFLALHLVGVAVFGVLACACLLAESTIALVFFSTVYALFFAGSFIGSLLKFIRYRDFKKVEHE